MTFMGLQISALLGGSVILESVFALPGLGTWGLAALRAQDYPIFLIFALYASGVLMLVNLIVDLLYAVLDPRITYS
jgi:peptide/nickel transport system permease protein